MKWDNFGEQGRNVLPPSRFTTSHYLDNRFQISFEFLTACSLILSSSSQHCFTLILSRFKIYLITFNVTCRNLNNFHNLQQTLQIIYCVVWNCAGACSCFSSTTRKAKAENVAMILLEQFNLNEKLDFIGDKNRKVFLQYHLAWK